MDGSIRIGPCWGQVLLDLEGFQVVRVNEPCGDPQALCQALANAAFVGVVVIGGEALFIDTPGGEAALRTSWSERWLQGMIRMASEASDPFSAAEVVRRVFLRRIFSEALQAGLDMEHCLEVLKEQARVSEARSLLRGDFGKAAAWHTWVGGIEDLEKRLVNLQKALGQFAVRLGNRYLKGGDP